MVQIDRQAKANIDRLDKRKQNVIRRVESLPERGVSGDWVVCCEERAADAVSVSVAADAAAVPAPAAPAVVSVAADSVAVPAPAAPAVVSVSVSVDVLYAWFEGRWLKVGASDVERD